MAEVFGAVSSGAGLLSLALQLLDGARRLKGFHERARDAPALLLDLSHELETVSLLLQQLERHRQEDNHDALLLERCISRCQEKTSQIQSLITNLDRKIQKFRGFGKAYFSFKDEEIRDSLQELERAKSAIMAAFQAYSWSRQCAHNLEQIRALDALKDVVASQNNHLQEVHATRGLRLNISRQSQVLLSQGRILEAEDDPAAAELWSQNQNSHTSALVKTRAQSPIKIDPLRRKVPSSDADRRSKKYHQRISFASWLTGRIWELAAIHAEGSWVVSLQTYNLVPFSSPIFQLCKRGDLEGVKNLLAHGEASVMDCDSDSDRYTPLVCAADYGRTNICRFLLTYCGSSISSQAKRAFTISIRHLRSHRELPENLYRLFMEEVDLDFDITDVPTEFPIEREVQVPFWMRNCPNQACIEIILKVQPLPYLSLPSEMRFQRAITFMWPQRFSGPNSSLKWAGLEAANFEFARFQGRNGKTALHASTEILGWLVSFPYFHEQATLLQEWADFSRDLLRLGSDPWAINRDTGFTPFMFLLYHAGRRLADCNCKDTYHLVKGLRLWTDILRQAGITLSDCGLKGSFLLDECWLRYKSDGKGYSIDLRPVIDYSTCALNLEVQWRNVLKVFELNIPPGAWPTTCPSTSVILWEPTDIENEEGPWTLKSFKVLKSTPVNAYLHTNDWDRDNYFTLLESSQDDCGIVARRIHRRKPEPSCPKRSSSEAPTLTRREMAHNRAYRSNTHYWAGNFHFCPYDMTLRFDCMIGYHAGVHAYVQVRDCLHGLSVPPDSIQDAIEYSLRYGMSKV